MFANKDVGSIDVNYFRIVTTSPFALTLQSKNTGHFWHLVYREANGHETCSVYHKHKETDSWHTQWGSKTLPRAIEAIKEHDWFQMNGRQTNHDREEARF